jgi:hypothetical protein
MNPPPFLENNYNLRTSNAQDVEKLSLPDFKKFCVERLGMYNNQIYESAAENDIPPQLLATVVLNELADIGWEDLMQEIWWPKSNYSFGIAQLTINTAMKYNLIPGQLDCRPGTPQTGKPNRAIVINRMTIPQYSINGAAKLVHIILEGMCQNTDKPWVKQNGFTLTDPAKINANSIYNYLAYAGAQRDREITLARIVVAAYNNDDIIIAQNPSSVDASDVEKNPPLYVDAIKHSNNAMWIAGRLYDLNLFH